MRRFPTLLFCLPALLFCGSAHAQEHGQDRFEVYASFNITHASQVPSGLVLNAGAYQPQYTGLTLVSLGGGATFNLFRLPVLTVGLDVHGSTHHGVAAANALETGLYGVKLAARLPHSHLRPWIEGSAGLLDAHATNASSPGAPAQAGNPTYASHYAVVAGTAGVDYTLLRHLDLRLFDVTGGTSFGAAPGISMWSADTGVVAHF